MRDNRIDNIEQFIINNNSVTLDMLCKTFSISKSTIRKDINEILKRGKIKKVYGGVCAISNSTPLPFKDRFYNNFELKSLISKCAAQFINNGDTIYIDSGSTTCQIIDYIKDLTDITVLTNSLEVINRSIKYPYINVVTLPGTLNRTTLSFTDIDTAEFIKRYNIVKAFMSATGITLHNGATLSTSWEYEIKRSIILKSNTNYLLAEHQKFLVPSLLTYSSLEKFAYIITDQELDYEFSSGYSQMGGNLLIVNKK